MSAVADSQFMRAPQSRNLLLLAALLAALWPVWRWFALRIADGTGDAWGLLSLGTALVVIGRARTSAAPAEISMALPSALLLFYAASYPLLPPLVRSVIAVTAVAAACSSIWFGKRLDVPLLGLMLLSLPIVSSLNFYLGCPLRVLTGTATQALLQLNGFAAVRDGALLQWNGRTVGIDAPCSGIAMLWAGLYLGFTLAAVARFDGMRTALFTIVVVTAILAANVVRASALFFVEAGVVIAPPQWHAGIGVITFLLAATAIATLASHVRARSDAY